MAGKKATKAYVTIEQCEKALWISNGLITPAAKSLGITQQALSERIKKSERLQKARELTTEKMLDAAENTLHRKIYEDENLTASIFYLKTKGRHRGYIERQEAEISGRNNAPIKIEWQIVEKPDDPD